MSALQLWLQNHNRRLTQDATDEALMEYIAHVEKQRDELLAAVEVAMNCIGKTRPSRQSVEAYMMLQDAIASVKGEMKMKYTEQAVETPDDAGSVIANKNIEIDQLRQRVQELELYRAS